MSAIVEIEEIVLVYDQRQLEDWKGGDKSLVPDYLKELKVWLSIVNQPQRFFGGIFVLDHYHRTAGWKGFPSYTLGPEFPHAERKMPGRSKVEEIIPAKRLARFRALRTTWADRRFGSGKPDLFLYTDDKRYKFVEVKKEGDTLKSPQLRCIAQILATLECEVDIVYLREPSRSHTPKVYCFDLAPFQR